MISSVPPVSSPATALFSIGRRGYDDAGVRRKVEIVRRALALHRPSAADPIGALAAVGGLGLAAHRVPVVLDGYICEVAALATHDEMATLAEVGIG